MTRALFAFAILGLLAGATQAGLIISGVVETGGDAPGSFATGDTYNNTNTYVAPSNPQTVPVFGEDVLCFTDRAHEYNGVTTAGLPGYLVGGDYVQIANNTRDNATFQLQVTLAQPAYLYVVRDQRSASTLPAWFSDGAGLDLAVLPWTTVGGTVVGYDEDGYRYATVGPGVGINNRANVYLATDTTTGLSLLPAGTYTLYENSTTNNMYGVIASTAARESMTLLEPGNWTNINFQLSGAEIPVGYEPDYGNAFGDRGNGLTYGWLADNTAAARDRNAVPDQRYDTLVHLHMGSHTEDQVWEIALGNGVYDLEIVCGDPSNLDQLNNLDVEGVLVNDPDGMDNFDTFTVLGVQVLDGRLTIKPGPNASNPKIMFLHITPEPATLALMGLGLAGLLLRRKR